MSHDTSPLRISIAISYLNADLPLNLWDAKLGPWFGILQSTPSTVSRQSLYLVRGEQDYAEIELLTFPREDQEEAFDVKLADEGLSADITAGVPRAFGEEKRLKSQMGENRYTKNNPRVVVHSNRVQKIREDNQGKIKSKMFFGNPQTIKLPFECVGGCLR